VYKIFCFFCSINSYCGVFVFIVYTDAEDEQLLEDEAAAPTDPKRSVLCLQLVVIYRNKKFSLLKQPVIYSTSLA